MLGYHLATECMALVPAEFPACVAAYCVMLTLHRMTTHTLIAYPRCAENCEGGEEIGGVGAGFLPEARQCGSS